MYSVYIWYIQDILIYEIWASKIIFWFDSTCLCLSVTLTLLPTIDPTRLGSTNWNILIGLELLCNSFPSSSGENRVEKMIVTVTHWDTHCSHVCRSVDIYDIIHTIKSFFFHPTYYMYIYIDRSPKVTTIFSIPSDEKDTFLICISLCPRNRQVRNHILFIWLLTSMK